MTEEKQFARCVLMCGGRDCLRVVIGVPLNEVPVTVEVRR